MTIVPSPCTTTSPTTADNDSGDETSLLSSSTTIKATTTAITKRRRRNTRTTTQKRKIIMNVVVIIVVMMVVIATTSSMTTTTMAFVPVVVVIPSSRCDTTTTTTIKDITTCHHQNSLLGCTPKTRIHGQLHLAIVALPPQRQRRSRPGRRISTTALGMAKPPPSSLFDLDAIEQLEETMMIQERQQKLEQEQQEQRQQSQEAIVATDDSDVVEENSDSNDDDDDNSNIQILVVPPELDGKRIDSVLSQLLSQQQQQQQENNSDHDDNDEHDIDESMLFSRSACGQLVSNGYVMEVVEDNVSSPTTTVVVDRKSYKVTSGTTLHVTIPPVDHPTDIIPQQIPINVVYEDEYMIVLNKAAGMVVHPAAGNWDGTVVNALAYYLQHDSPYGQGDFVTATSSSSSSTTTSSIRPGIVHRLDKGTTGILVVAKTERALTKLSEAFASRKVHKTYLAITVGNPGKHVVIDKPIGRHPIHRQRMRVVPNPHQQQQRHSSRRSTATTTGSSSSGKRALSHVDTIAFDGKLSLAKVRIETGRTHQIRCHLKDRRTPIYGDDVYGITEWNKILIKTHGIARPLLHAYRLQLDHPIHGHTMEFVAPMDVDMSTVAKTICTKQQQQKDDQFVEDLQHAFAEE